ncbi:MAG TPA: hypothetical protein VK668_07310 [Mucilaginibacter sp.]|nr:hypothetical protein [Mucilaginibacter sp.]
MIKRVCLLALVTFACLSCGKSGDVIPNVPVNFQMNINDPRMSPLHAPGGAVLVDGYGIAGLVIYRRSDMSYAAYDRCSSYMPEKKCAVTLDNNSLTCTDPCSGAKFSLDDGGPVKAPATRSLKAYSINVSNFEIFVSN